MIVRPGFPKLKWTSIRLSIRPTSVLGTKNGDICPVLCLPTRMVALVTSASLLTFDLTTMFACLCRLLAVGLYLSLWIVRMVVVTLHRTKLLIPWWLPGLTYLLGPKALLSLLFSGTL